MVEPRHQGTFEALDALVEHHRDAIAGVCEQLRGALGVPAYRVWFCPFSGHELIELGSSVDIHDDGRSKVFFASTAEQLREEPLRALTLLRFTEEGEHPRWDCVIRDLDISASPHAPLWEADLCLGDEQPERIGVVTLFDPSGHAGVPDELTTALRAETRALLLRLTEGLAAYRQARYDREIIGALERPFTSEIVRNSQPPQSLAFFEDVAQWFHRIARPERGSPGEGLPTISPNTCALYIKDENRLVLMDATEVFKAPAAAIADHQYDNPLTSIPIDQDDGSLLSFVYEVLGREHQPLIFPSGRSDGPFIMSLVEDLRQRIARLATEDDGSGLSGTYPLDGSGAPVTPRSARSMLRNYFQRIKHRGSCGFFPLMRRGDVEGVFVLLSTERTFFQSANVLLVRAIADRLCRLPDLLPDHRQDKDYRDRKTRLIYVEQRHQRIDRYLTGGQRVQAVAFLNLDGFRDLNDTYGHKLGDRVLESIMEGLVVAAHRPGMLGNRYSALQFVEQEKAKIDAEQYAATELSNTRRRKALRLLPLHYGGDEFGLVFLGRDEGNEKEIVFVCQQVVVDLLSFLRFRLAGNVDAGRLSMSAGLALPSRLDDQESLSRNEFALYSGLRELGDSLMYYAKGIDGLSLYCPGHTVVEHRFELVIDEGGPSVWRASLVSSKEVGDRVPMSGDVLQLDLLYSLERTVGRHVRNGEDREAILRRIKKTIAPVRFEVLYRLPRASGRGAREEYLVRQIDEAVTVSVGVGDQLYGHVVV